MPSKDKDLNDTLDAVRTTAAASQANLDAVFEGCEPLPGAEEFGRAIVDADGVPSGSPANYEYLRGAAPGALTGPELEQAIGAAIASAVAAVAAPGPDADR